MKCITYMTIYIYDPDWYEVKTYTKDDPWQRMATGDVIYLVTWLWCKLIQVNADQKLTEFNTDQKLIFGGVSKILKWFP